MQLRHQYLVSGHPTIQDPPSVPEEFDDPLDRTALAFQYMEECYTLWLDLHDEFTECNQNIEERYREYHSSYLFQRWTLISTPEKRNERVKNELDEKTKLLGKLNAEYKKLQSSAVCFYHYRKLHPRHLHFIYIAIN